MKSNAVPSYQSSAYPLKALKLNSREENEYVDSSKQSLLKVASSFKVLPMVNPYPGQQKKADVQDLDWFNHYE
jgi:hypothetical protein